MPQKRICLAALTIFVLIAAVVGRPSATDCWVFTCIADQSYHKAEIEPVKMFVEHHGWDVRRLPPKPDKITPKKVPFEIEYREASFEKAWLEYSESGKLFDDAQRISIIKKIRNYGTLNKPILVIVFVHGWHQNANDRLPNVAGNNAIKFDYFMARQVDSVRRYFEQQGVDKSPAVVGIYVGWRGERYSNEWWNLATIKDRAEAADRLGGSGHLRRDLNQIADEVRSANAKNKIMVIGHSLGGRVLTKALINDVTNLTPAALGARSLVVTLNAAVNADCFDGIFLGNPNLNGKGHPSWINVTSKEDEATNWVYHSAGLFSSLAPPPCGRGERRAIGHYSAYVTHSLYFNVLLDGQTKSFPESPEQAKQIGLSDLPPDYPPLPNETGWFKTKKSNGVLAYKMFDLEDAHRKVQYYYQPDSLFYAYSFREENPVGSIGSVWNVITDKNTINLTNEPGRAPVEDRLESKHNGYVSTNLTRMFIELLYSK